MQTVVQKWGNSLGIRIPNLYVKEFDLRNGSSVEIVEEIESVSALNAVITGSCSRRLGHNSLSKRWMCLVHGKVLYDLERGALMICIDE